MNSQYGLLSDKMKEEVFQKELEKLYEENRITIREYSHMKKAYFEHIDDRNKGNILKSESLAVEKNKKNEIEEKTKEKKEKIEKPKKILSPQEVKERNITWTLILGVILLLISGLIFATNNWENMHSVTKTLFVSIIAAAFFGMSLLSGKVFKIEKTAFAFLVLGSLFMPIIVLTAGYFSLFGEWFSFNGEGKYLFGFTGSLLCLPVYFKIANRFKSRLFIWFTYLNLSLIIGTLLASFKLPIDTFYLGIVLYNAALLVFYHFNQNKEKYSIFMNELTAFAQTNLIVSTILMLIMFDNKAIFGFNAILVSILYLAMIFISNQKNYHYVFSLMLVYGLYQLIENTFLMEIDLALIGLISYLFVLIGRKLNEEEYLRKAFDYTSGIVSFFAFIFVSYQGITLRMEQPTMIMFFAYLFIAINYIYLSYKTSNKLFSYLSSIFMLVAGYQSFKIISKFSEFKEVYLYMFFVGAILYLLFYRLNKSKYTLNIKQSNFLLTNLVMIISLFGMLVEKKWLELSVTLIIYGALNYVTLKSHENKEIKEVSSWFMPSTLFLSILSIYPLIVKNNKFYEDNFSIAFHVIIGSLIILGGSYLFKNIKEYNLENKFIWVSLVTYIIGLVMTFEVLIEERFVLLSLFVLAVPVFTYINKKLNIGPLWLTVSLSIFMGYTIFYENTLVIKNEGLNSLMFVLSFVTVLVARKIYKRIDINSQKYFFWTANVLLLFSLFRITFDEIEHTFTIIMTTLIFAYNLLIVDKKPQKIMYVFLSLIYLNLSVVSLIGNFSLDFEIEEIVIKGSLLLITISIYKLWLWIREENWKGIVKTYLLFSTLILSIISTWDIYRDFYVYEIFISLSFLTIGLLAIHKMKYYIVSIMPIHLLFLYIGKVNDYVIQNELSEIIVWILFFFVLKTIGERIYEELINLKKKKIDWFSIYGLISLMTINYWYSDFLYKINILLFIMPNILIVYLLYSQAKRFKKDIHKKAITTIASLVGLIPYYQFIDYLNIPDILSTELNILPWIALVMFLSNKTWSTHKITMSNIEWIVLIISSFALIRDVQRSDGILETIILGIIALSSLLYGFKKQIKSFFFIGIFVLLLNIMIKTKPLWSTMPWWAYLLIVGSILIGVASYNEWKKQNKNENIWDEQKRRLAKIFENWT